jgi:hypothetical protein
LATSDGVDVVIDGDELSADPDDDFTAERDRGRDESRPPGRVRRDRRNARCGRQRTRVIGLRR